MARGSGDLSDLSWRGGTFCGFVFEISKPTAPTVPENLLLSHIIRCPCVCVPLNAKVNAAIAATPKPPAPLPTRIHKSRIHRIELARSRDNGYLARLRSGVKHSSRPCTSTWNCVFS